VQLAIVQGRATSVVKHPSLNKWRLLVCQPLGNTGEAYGDPLLALDHHGAGTGDRVMISSDGRGLRDRMNDPTSPARWWTLGIVD